jgi:hypothetical protein
LLENETFVYAGLVDLRLRFVSAPIPQEFREVIAGAFRSGGIAAKAV